jgi:hypothetical protein
MWVAIHKCMEAMLRISLYSYLYLKLAKMTCLSFYLLFSLQQNQRTRGLNRFCLEAGREGRWHKQYTHVSKCKNDKRRKKETVIKSLPTKKNPTLNVCTAKIY